MDKIMTLSGAGVAAAALIIRIIMHFHFRTKEEKLKSLLDQKYGKIE